MMLKIQGEKKIHFKMYSNTKTVILCCKKIFHKITVFALLGLGHKAWVSRRDFF